MFSWEIDNFLNEHNFEFVNYKQIADILNTSSQINCLKYTGSDEYYAYYLLATNDGYSWDIKFKKD